MNHNPVFAASDLSEAQREKRERSLTSWMSPDLCQATTDFCRNIGLAPIYAESSTSHQTRYLFWNPPEKAGFEVRSGRDQATFLQFDEKNRKRQWELISLHISEDGKHSAVWMAPEHLEVAVDFLENVGISPAVRLGRRS